MISLTATIRNAHGIHCRPSAVIVKEVRRYRARIRVRCAHGEARADSVVDLLALGMEAGTDIVVEVEADGDDERAICERMVALFETHYDFPSLSRSEGRTGAPPRA